MNIKLICPNCEQEITGVRVVIDTVNPELPDPPQINPVKNLINKEKIIVTDNLKNQERKICPTCFKYFHRELKQSRSSWFKQKYCNPGCRPGYSRQSSAGYCQNPYCLNHDKKEMYDKSKMFEFDKMLFCSEECMNEYKQNPEGGEE
jgi:hypothetical protein